MSDFKGRHFEGEIVLWAVRWYCRYGVSYRDLEQMMGERGVLVDHSTIYRWVQRYAPEMEKRLRWQWRTPRSTSWRVDETYVKVRGQWAYLYRAVDKHGNTIDFYLSPTRNTAAAKRFLGKAMNGRHPFADVAFAYKSDFRKAALRQSDQWVSLSARCDRNSPSNPLPRLCSCQHLWPDARRST